MSAPSVTYRFIAGSLISEREHNQNNADLIAAITDGTKDLEIRSILTNNHGSFYGTTTTFGNSTSDTITANGTVSTNILPSSTSINIGSTSFPWRALYLDNGSTDGGAIYFGSASKYMKCSADGTKLDFSGFSTYDFNSKTINSLSGLSNGSMSVTGNLTISNNISGGTDIFSCYATNNPFSSTQNFLSSLTDSGFIMRSSGSIYCVSVQAVVESYVSSGTLTFYVYKNGSSLFTITSAQSVTANAIYSFKDSNIAKSTYTFSANDLITVYINRTGSYGVSGYVTIGVYYDS